MNNKGLSTYHLPVEWCVDSFEWRDTVQHTGLFNDDGDDVTWHHCG